MLSDVQVFADAVQAADKVYHNETETLNARRMTREISYEQYNDAERALRRTHRETVLAAWQRLATSGDQLVAWIATNVDVDYQHQAIKILRELPAPLGKLDKIAGAEGWCHIWEDYRTRAIAAGVVEVRFDLRMRVNGQRAEQFWAVGLPNGDRITRKMLEPLFIGGATMIQVNAGSDHVVYELATDQD
jgi:hypothetical protein